MSQSSRRSHARRVAGVVLAVLAATLAGCSGVAGVADEQVYQTADGVLLVDTYTVVATVTAIDAAGRNVRLTDPDGKSTTLKAARDVDLGRFAIGETIAIQVTEETALTVRRAGAPAAATAEIDLAAARGAGGNVAFTSAAVEVSAVVAAVDAPNRRVTFRLVDGTQKTVRVHKGVDLSGLAAGDTVVVGVAEQVVIATVQP